MVSFDENAFEIPLAQYMGTTLQFIGVTTGFSTERPSERTRAIRQGEDVSMLTEDVVKLSVHDKDKNEMLSVDMPLDLLSSIETDYAMGDVVKLDELRIRFYIER